MDTLVKLKLLKRLDNLIRRKSTGTAEQLAERLEISKRSVFRLIKLLKEIEAPIAYCKDRPSYIYLEDFDFDKKILEEIG